MAAHPFEARRSESKLRVTLPEHDGFVADCGVQWWYWTGHFHTDAGRQFGFEIVYFVFKKWGGLVATLCHQALTDIEGGRFLFDEYTRPFQLPHATPGRFAFVSDDSKAVEASGGNGVDHLRSRLQGIQLDAELRATKPPTIHYEGTAHPYAGGGYTLYYSRKRMALEGTLRLTPDAPAERIRGDAWFDRQYGELLPAIALGWQWFGLQLLDGRELMLFVFPGVHHAVESFGSLTDAAGRNRVLTPDDFLCHSTGEWPSPHTGTRYPSGWEIHIPSESLDLVIKPQLLDQELHGELQYWPGPEYWEGACAITDPEGALLGRGYVELDGYNQRLFGRLDTD